MLRAGIHPFYPIVPDAAWAARVARAGAYCLQLRMKGLGADAIRREIATALEACAPLDCQVIVNDFWREAIAEGADYVHLGQEDLQDADIELLRDNDVRVGISTHDEDELATALRHSPDYVALGPIYGTTTKDTGRAAQGLERIRQWKELIGPIPLVAIGGITLERASEVMAAGAQSVAVISDVVGAPDPEARIEAWLAWAETIER